MRLAPPRHVLALAVTLSLGSPIWACGGDGDAGVDTARHDAGDDALEVDVAEVNDDANGQPTGSTRRRPRMISRQIFAYVAGYLMTGDESLLGHAAAGVEWLRAHAIDRERDGCHPELEADGSAVPGVRTAQDQAYCMLGLAAWVFATRDAEADLLNTRQASDGP